MYYETDRVFGLTLILIAIVILYLISRAKTPRDNTEERRQRKMRREQTLRDWL